MTLYAVGRILKSFGIKGFVKVEPLTHSVERFIKLEEVYVGMGEDGAVKFSVEQVKISPMGVFVKLKTIDTRTSSDRIASHYIFVDERHLVLPPKGSYFVHDILGCTVWVEQGWTFPAHLGRSGRRQIGTVVEVYSKEQGLAQDVWVIEHRSNHDTKAKRYWLPVLSESIQEVNVPQHTIVLRGTIEPLEE